jgi:hypothetical protein
VATATLTEPDVVTTSNGTMKRRAKRLGTITASLMALIALGVSFAFFVSNQDFGNNSATGGRLLVEAVDLPLEANNLFPTRASDGGPNAVEDKFALANNNPATVRYTMTAKCDNCLDPKTTEAAQFENLRIIVIDDATKRELYRGRLADMNAGFTGTPQQQVQQEAARQGLATFVGGPVQFGTVPAGTKPSYTTRIWLGETGSEQPQNVLNTWTFTISGRTV